MLKDTRKYACDIYSTWAQGTYLYVKWAEENKVNYYELLILYALETYEVMTQKAMGDLYGLPKQTVNNVIRELKKEGRVILKPGEKDKREKQVSLTDSGGEYAKNLLSPLYRIEERVCDKIGRERLVQMTETSELYNLLFDQQLKKVGPNG